MSTIHASAEVTMKNARGNNPLDRRKTAARGVMLIEALVALLVFAFGVLGLVGLQASMTKAQSTAKFRADAAFLAQQLVGTMWADAPLNLSNYATANCAGYPRCSEWSSKVADVLPAGTAAIQLLPEGWEVKISWTQPNEGTHTYTTLTTIALN
jgi:type IV pilus assembly protein PilV